LSTNSTPNMNILHVIVIFSMISYLTADKAVAVLKPSNSTVQGVIRFEENVSGETIVRLNITGLYPQGDHGFHIHQFGDLTNECLSAGPHYNPNNLTHGPPNDNQRHVGDLGNIVADSNGSAVFQITDSQIKLLGVHSVLGRAVVVHALRDDLGLGTGDKKAESKKTGNAGARLACGVIGISST
jgi:Cu-Zn family superoxide dismutase